MAITGRLLKRGKEREIISFWMVARIAARYFATSQDVLGLQISFSRYGRLAVGQMSPPECGHGQHCQE